MKKIQIVICLLFCLGHVDAQNVTSRSNEFEIDVTDPSKYVSSVIPVINWIAPLAESNYSNDVKYKIKFEIESKEPLKNVVIIIKENVESATRGRRC